jgi:nucleotide-binding universal stress UspA family protein
VNDGRVHGRPTIVVGVDGSSEARAALGFALDDAARRGARVRVVCVFEEPDYWAVSYGMSAPAPMREVTIGLKKAARQVVEDVRAEHARRAAVDVVALIGLPAKVLLEQARDADLLVLGNRGRGGLRNTVLGSVGFSVRAAWVRSGHDRPPREAHGAADLTATPRLSAAHLEEAAALRSRNRAWVGTAGSSRGSVLEDHLAARHGAQHIAPGHDPDQLAVVDYRD